MVFWPRTHARYAAREAKVYIYHIDHDHDRTYAENIVQYLESQGAFCRSIPLRSDGLRPELQLCLDDHATAVVSFNSTLDHSWLPSGSFLAEAEARKIPVLQWILDHPSSRWHEFSNSTAANSCFLLNSKHMQDYFNDYCLPNARTATTGGVGPNRRSRVAGITEASFMQRHIACMIPLSLHRVDSMIQNDANLKSLDAPLASAAQNAIERARFDLVEPLHTHVAAALSAENKSVPDQMFHFICKIVEQSVQTIRRLKIFSIARRFPVLVQSDDSAAAYFNGANASLETNVNMQFTLARFSACRSVLSVSPNSDMIHDRTMNAVNGGCAAILEDNKAGKSVFEHGKNALLFRYDDESIEECLDIVCNQPEYAYQVALEGIKLRDDPLLRFGQFHNILDLARQAAGTS